MRVNAANNSGFHICKLFKCALAIFNLKYTNKSFFKFENSHCILVRKLFN